MKPIRVLQVLTIMNRGGAETMIMNYYRNIDRTKVQFDFLLHRPEKGAFDDEILVLGGKIYRMSAISPKNYLGYKKQLKIFFEEHKEYHIVHSHLNALSSIVLKVAKEQGVNTRIAHSHIAIEPWVLKKILYRNTDIKATVKDSVQSLLSSRVKKYANHYFACSTKAGLWLFGKENSSKIKIINNAIDAKTFAYNKSLSEKTKIDLGLSGTKIIGHVGRFNEQKNHFLLVKIFKELAMSRDDIILVLVGDGNLKPKIEHYVSTLGIANKIHFLGVRDDIPSLLQAFDLFLFPSLYEGLPVTLVEAQAAGLKIITSSTVSQEVAITDLVSFCALEDSEKIWANKVIENIDYTRENTTEQIISGNYDITSNAIELQAFYLKNK
jgi:glycosyltransferase involved in cell wall biosynthesis